MLPSKTRTEFLWAFILSLTNFLTISFADVPRPRGVSLLNANLYTPSADNTWACLDNSRKIKYIQINDNYCDCADGSDEPGTPACPEGKFHCENRGHRSQDIPTSRINDRICDCCDGSDEYVNAGMCENVCINLGKAEEEQRLSLLELYKKGATKRSEMIMQAKQFKAEGEKRRSELEVQLREQESLKSEKLQLKTQAEAAEQEAINLFKEELKRKEELAAEDALRAEAEIHFSKYDINNDNFIDVAELQADLELDIDKNGVVSEEEAMKFLIEENRVQLNSFKNLTYPLIKEFKEKLQNLKNGSVGEQEADEVAELINEENRNDQEEEVKKPGLISELDEDEEEYEDEDAGTGSVEQESAPNVEYDPETQRYIDIANEARNALSEVEKNLHEIQQSIKEIDDQNAKDYGPHNVYSALEGECYNFEERDYVYKLCPFQRASQQPRSGGSEITLGRWEEWLQEGENKYVKQRYAQGASCWNGPQRSVVVNLKCAVESRLTGVDEPNRCEYYFDFETPAACDEETLITSEEWVRDEL